MKLLSSAKGLPSNGVPKHKFGGGRRRKTSHAADTFEDRNPEETSVNSTGCKKSASRADSKRFMLNNAGSPPEGLRFSLP